MECIYNAKTLKTLNGYRKSNIPNSNGHCPTNCSKRLNAIWFKLNTVLAFIMDDSKFKYTMFLDSMLTEHCAPFTINNVHYRQCIHIQFSNAAVMFLHCQIPNTTSYHQSGYAPSIYLRLTRLFKHSTFNVQPKIKYTQIYWIEYTSTIHTCIQAHSFAQANHLLLKTFGLFSYWITQNGRQWSNGWTKGRKKVWVNTQNWMCT